jgi:hypothetical protein
MQVAVGKQQQTTGAQQILGLEVCSSGAQPCDDLFRRVGLQHQAEIRYCGRIVMFVQLDLPVLGLVFAAIVLLNSLRRPTWATAEWRVEGNIR